MLGKYCYFVGVGLKYWVMHRWIYLGLFIGILE